MKKKVLLMVPMLHQGGFERVCVRTARLLQEYCEVSILIFSGDDIAYDVKNINIIDIHIKSQDGKIHKIRNVWKRITKVKRIKRTLGIDITYSFGITANLVNIFTKVQDVLWIGIRGYTDLGSKWHPLLCKRADKIVCCSKEIEHTVKNNYPAKEVISVYNPYDITMIQRQSEEPVTNEEQNFFHHHQVIISMGREDEVKGFWHLLRSFKVISSNLSNARLMIIGEGEYKENKQFAKVLGIEDKVIFTGVKKNPFPYLKRADVYVLTSLNEGFPNALVEAMALGIPVAAVNCKSGPAEILCEDYTKVCDNQKVYYAEYGILLPKLQENKNLDIHGIEKEEEILAEEVQKMLQNDKMRETYRAAGLKRAGEFSDYAYIENMLRGMAAK